MHCVYKVTDNMYWIGGNERKLSVFEGVIPMPEGMAYNSYFIDDEKTVVLDTVDQAVSKVFYENVDYLLGGNAPASADVDLDGALTIADVTALIDYVLSQSWD